MAREAEPTMNEEAREDRVAYCPRVDAEVFILSGRCFFLGRNKILCNSCIYDLDFVKVKLIRVLCDLIKNKAEEQTLFPSLEELKHG
jgi:hypothetical protein